MADSCLTDCDLKKQVSEIYPLVKEVHEILSGAKAAFKILKVTAFIFGALGVFIGSIWGVFVAIRG